jgi:hypothetical protein
MWRVRWPAGGGGVIMRGCRGTRCVHPHLPHASTVWTGLRLRSLLVQPLLLLLHPQPLSCP